jgi:hypothetical protein
MEGVRRLALAPTPRIISVFLALLALTSPACAPTRNASTVPLPSQLTDADFWRLSTEWSEPEGSYQSEGLTSNESLFQHVIPALSRRIRPGGVYVGVGPEQNFSYIAAVRPTMAIIVDIRRRNLQLHLMYKALFELSADRAEFVSKLFAKPRPTGVTLTSTPTELFEAFDRSRRDDALYRETATAIMARLATARALPLSAADRDGIAEVYRAFYENGFALRISPTYADLMTQTDADGVPRSFLATEERFHTVRTLHVNNQIIPVVGDFAGARTFRELARYLRGHGATVSSFYVSNVEQYLRREGKWPLFCRNVATLPLDQSSTFIRALTGGPGFIGGYNALFVSRLARIVDETEDCVA